MHEQLSPGALLRGFFWQEFHSWPVPRTKTMLLKIECTCSHIGLVNAETLPRELRCWQCGASRYIEARAGARIVSRAAVIEWLLGEHKVPRAQIALARPRRHDG